MAALRIWLEQFLEEWDKTHLRGKKNSDFYSYQGGGSKVWQTKMPTIEHRSSRSGGDHDKRTNVSE